VHDGSANLQPQHSTSISYMHTAEFGG